VKISRLENIISNFVKSTNKLPFIGVDANIVENFNTCFVVIYVDDINHKFKYLKQVETNDIRIVKPSEMSKIVDKLQSMFPYSFYVCCEVKD
jgi:hypothetical protein